MSLVLRTLVGVSLVSALSFLPVTAFGQAVAESKPVDRAASYYHYGLARIYEGQALSSGRQDLATQAIEQYKLALDADADSRALQDGLANLYFRLGRVREAVSAAQDQVNRHPNDIDAHMLLGRVYLRSLGDGQGPQTGDVLQAAIKEYETIVSLKPQDSETRLLLGKLYGLNHESVKAEQQFKEAEKVDGPTEEVVLSLARLYSEMGDFERAAKVIADVPPEDRSGRMDFALAAVYDQLKKPKEAAETYQLALNEDPDNTDAKKGLAAALAASGQSEAAAKIYAQILTSDPQDPQSLVHQAELERQAGHYEQSLSTLQKAEALVSDSLEVGYNKALDYDALGRFDDAIKTIKRMLTISASPDGKYTDADRSNRALFLNRLGLAQREAGLTSDAVATYQAMSELGGEYQAQGADGAVEAYRDAHQWAAALKTSAAAAAAMPKNHAIQLTYARQLADAGKIDDALKLAAAQMTGTPDDREVLFTEADINVRAKRWKDASALLDKAETMAVKSEDKVFVYYYRGTVADRQKFYEQAEMEDRKGLAIDPANAAIQNDLGYMLADRGVKLPEAVTLLQNAVKADPQNYAYLDSLAWAYYKSGQYSLAEDYSRKAAQRNHNDPTILDHLGEIFAKNGKLQMAIVEWQKSLAAYATSLPPEADPADVAKVERKLEGARIRMAHATTTSVH